MSPFRILPFAVTLLVSVASAQGQSQGLHALAVKAGLEFFGTATEVNNFGDAPYMSIVGSKDEFGLVVPENSQKWGPIEPLQNQFNFTNPDKVAAQAKSRGQLLRCHTLTWHSQLPSFVQTSHWTRENLTAAIRAHITTVVTHYRGQCHSWDVVNEALADNGTFRQSVFFNTLGTDYIPISFAAAAAADPSAKLYYNDFSLEFDSNKTAGALRIVKLVQDAGARIDGVGFQAHMVVGQTPSRARMAAVLQKFTALGVEVAMTELDIRHSRLPVSATAAEQQAVEYGNMVGACVDVKGCVGVVLWQFTDKYSWVPSTFPGAGDACMFDANMTRKAAYTTVAIVLAAGPQPIQAATQGGRTGGQNSTVMGAGAVDEAATNPMSGMPPIVSNVFTAGAGGTLTRALDRSLSVTFVAGVLLLSLAA